MNNKEVNIILKPTINSPEDQQKRVDDISKVLYKLYCQYQKTDFFHNNQTTENLTKEAS